MLSSCSCALEDDGTAAAARTRPPADPLPLPLAPAPAPAEAECECARCRSRAATASARRTSGPNSRPLTQHRTMPVSATSRLNSSARVSSKGTRARRVANVLSALFMVMTASSAECEPLAASEEAGVCCATGRSAVQAQRTTNRQIRQHASLEFTAVTVDL